MRNQALRIALVKPFHVSDSIQPILGLGYLASAVGHREVVIFDGIRDRLGPRAIADRIRAFDPALVGLQVLSFGLDHTLATLAAIREAMPSARIVLGGPHPTLVPQDALATCGSAIDYLVRGEGEDSIRRLSEVIEQGEGTNPSALATVPGLVWRENGMVRQNSPSVTDLSRYTMPRWDLMDPRLYPPAPHSAFYRSFPVAPVIASRGCPLPCSFCGGGLILGKRIRYRSLDAVIEEIRLLHDHYQVREIHFVDDNLTHDRDYVRRLCDAILSLPFRIDWSLPNGARLDNLDRPLLEHMKAAGCYAMGLGIESGSPRILQRIRKGITPDLVREKVELLQQLGFHTRGFFLMGLPGETEEDILATMDFSLSLPLDAAHYMFFHPIPGTRAYEEARNEGMILHDGHAPTFAEVAYVPDGLTEKRLRSLQRAAFLRFYLRWRAMYGLIGQVRGLTHLYYLLRRILRWLA